MALSRARPGAPLSYTESPQSWVIISYLLSSLRGFRAYSQHDLAELCSQLTL